MTSTTVHAIAHAMNADSGTALRAKLNTSTTKMMLVLEATMHTMATGVRVRHNAALLTPALDCAVGHCDAPITADTGFKWRYEKRCWQPWHSMSPHDLAPTAVAAAHGCCVDSVAMTNGEAQVVAMSDIEATLGVKNNGCITVGWTVQHRIRESGLNPDCDRIEVKRGWCQCNTTTMHACTLRCWCDGISNPHTAGMCVSRLRTGKQFCMFQ